MKTRTQAARVCAVAGLAAVTLGAGGCATTGEAPGAAADGGSAPAMGKADFYAEWYEASAVVLPPPPQPAPTAKR